MKKKLIRLSALSLIGAMFVTTPIHSLASVTDSYLSNSIIENNKILVTSNNTINDELTRLKEDIKIIESIEESKLKDFRN